MALINCPECGREKVSESAVSCPICGYGIKKHFDELKIEEEKTRVAEQIKKKSELDEKIKNEELDNKAKFVYTPQSKPHINGYIIVGILCACLAVLAIVIESWGLMCLEIFFSIVFLVGGFSKLQNSQKLYEDYSINQDEYKRQLLIAKEREKEIRNANKNVVNLNSQDIVKCPKCGSTQIQAVSRKWSLMTGILTNKVDRVCLNCKHKF